MVSNKASKAWRCCCCCCFAIRSWKLCTRCCCCACCCCMTCNRFSCCLQKNSNWLLLSSVGFIAHLQLPLTDSHFSLVSFFHKFYCTIPTSSLISWGSQSPSSVFLLFLASFRFRSYVLSNDLVHSSCFLFILPLFFSSFLSYSQMSPRLSFHPSLSP